jgi:hypothetical protein
VGGRPASPHREAEAGHARHGLAAVARESRKHLTMYDFPDLRPLFWLAGIGVLAVIYIVVRALFWGIPFLMHLQYVP